MLKSRWLATLLLVFVTAPASVHAGEADEASLDILLSTLRSNKKALVDVNLGLTDQEARDFWPVYDRYQAELAVVQDRLVAVIQDYLAAFERMDHEHATRVVTDYLAVEQDRAELRSRYLAPISEALPGMKVMRFYQIENKIHAVLMYDLAGSVPVVALAPGEK